MNIELLITFLKDRGRYKPTFPPLHILDVDFAFDAVLIGPEDHNGLVLVHEVRDSSLGSISNELKALSIALQRTESTRAVTLLLVGDLPMTPPLSELNKLCRVIVVSSEASFEESLASILPLDLPQAIASSESADAALKAEASFDFSDPLISKLLKAAKENETEVQKAMRSTIDEIARLPNTV